MQARARETSRHAVQERYAGAETEDAGLDARDVLETLESGGREDDDIATTRGLVNGAALGAVVWAVAIATYSILA